MVTLLRVLIKHQAKAWDLLLPHAEFAYNKSPSKATGLSPFKVVYGTDPLSPLDLIPRPLDQKPSADVAARVEEIQKLHELVKAKIRKLHSHIRPKLTSIKERSSSSQVIWFRYIYAKNVFHPKGKLS